MIKFKKSLCAALSIAMLSSLSLLSYGCGKKNTETTYNTNVTNTEYSSDKSDKTDTIVTTEKKIQISEKYNLNLTLENYSMPGVFTMSKPSGWNVYKAGEYTTLGVLTRDEKQPLRQAFLFGNIGIFYVSAQQKQTEQYYQQNGGYDVPWVDMPVVSPFNGTNFLKNFNSIMNSQIGQNFLGSAGMPIPEGFQNIQILSEQKVSSLIPGTTSVLVRALLNNNGTAAQGMFTLTTYSDSYGHGSAYLVAGVTAPVNEYISAEDTLLASIKSFKMEDSYVSKGMQVITDNGEAFKKISETLSETSDIITDGWNARNKSYDVSASKYSDQIMGVERVYDSESGDVYEVENGFYDYYKTHQDQYQQKDLQPIPDNNYDLWGKAPLLNHSLVLPK